MLRVFLGIILVLIGALTTWKADWIYRNLGPVEWAEKHLGFEGGTRLYYKLIGLAIIFLGFFVISGLWTDILNGFLGMLGMPTK
jgi:hypothetical protein